MCPYAEAGSRSILFGGNVTAKLYVDTLVVATEYWKELQTLHESNEPLTITPDQLGSVTLDGEPVKQLKLDDDVIFKP